MITTETYTVERKVKSLRDGRSVELRRSPFKIQFGLSHSAPDLPETITLHDEDAKGLELGDKVRLTLEKVK